MLHNKELHELLNKKFNRGLFMKNNKHYVYGFMVLLLLSLVFFFSCKGAPVPEKENGLDAVIPVDPEIPPIS
jgi:hypothetical protein